MARRTWIGGDATNPNRWSVAANWLEAAVPVNGDEQYFGPAATTGVTDATGLSQSAITGTAIVENFGFSIGTGTAYLQLAASSLLVRSTTGTNRLMFDFGSTINTTRIVDTSNSGTDDLYGYGVVQLKGTGLTLVMGGGTASVAPRSGETSTAVIVVTNGGASTSPQLLIGEGVTKTSLNVAAGTVTDRSTVTCPVAAVGGGTLDYRGTGAFTVLNVDAGVCYYSGTGTITAGQVGRGRLDFSRDGRAKTITALSLLAGYYLNLDNGVPGSIVIASGALTFSGCGIHDGKLITPDNVKIGLAAA
jgi:hypothetical protein